MRGSRVTPRLLLLLLTLQVHLSRAQRTPPARGEAPKRLYETLKRLDEQFKTFQEMTLAHLQSIAKNLSVSHGIDRHFQELTQRFERLSREMGSFNKDVNQNLSALKSWSRKLQKKTKRLELRLAVTERALKERGRLAQRQLQEQRVVLSNLTRELGAQHSRLGSLEAPRGPGRGLWDVLQEQRAQLSKLEVRMRSMEQPLLNASTSISSRNPLVGTWRSPDPGPDPGLLYGAQRPLEKEVSRMRNRPPPPLRMATRAPYPDHTHETTRSAQTSSSMMPLPEEEAQIHNLLQLPFRHKIPQKYTPKKEATICNVNSMLLFPSASNENYATFRTPFPAGVHELSVCTWLKVEAGYVGTLLSYATADNDNTLVLYGRRSSVRGAVDFVIGDPAYRELEMDTFLDGRWHHACLIWTSIEGRFWYYADRRLAATGSKFQKGFEMPPGGTVVLGQEQDVVGGGFDEAEAFVGRLAGFAMWSRALSPREVSGLATGEGMPRGAVMTLDDVVLHGSVHQVTCECLEHCT
ncbi:pentraxin-4 [Brachyhypopomus gauderio]|uniref:pentraxin-4 n=1 Tax=Brachyhypopomus gauderio TaxID=698409 RepID=UPI00404279DA